MSHDLPSFDVSVLLVRDVAGAYRPAVANEVLQAAQRLLGQQMRGREVLSSPQVVRDFLRLRLGRLEHEVFAVLMLDAQHRLIEYVGLSARGGEGVAGAQCGGADPGAQPSFGCGGTFTGRRAPDANAEGGAVASGRAGARSPDRGGQ